MVWISNFAMGERVSHPLPHKIGKLKPVRPDGRLWLRLSLFPKYLMQLGFLFTGQV
jgi:hypothetical protein